MAATAAPPASGPVPAAEGAERVREPGRLVLGAMAVAIGLAALVNPKLPGHAGPVDVAIVVAVCLAFVWTAHSRARLQLPYGIPMTAYMLTGLVAALFSLYPSDGLVAIVQEVFLLAWCVAIATLCTTPRVLGVLLRVWSVSATLWGALLIAAVGLHVRAVSGQGSTAGGRTPAGGEGNRARLFLDHPNMAGNFFMIAFFIVLASGYPKRLWLRATCCAVLVVAMFLTGSNAALLSLVVGSVVTAFLHVRARAGLVKATAVVSVLSVVLGLGFYFVALPAIHLAQQSSNVLIQDSVARSQKSAVARQSLFAWQFSIYEQGKLVGIGPNGTQETLGASAAPAVKTAHNDYLGTLDERGPLGLLAVLVLIGVTGARLVSITRRPLPRRLAAALPVPGALAGACVAFAVTAFTHEILHYRWLYALLGIVAAAHLLHRREEQDTSRPGPARTTVGRTPEPGPPDLGNVVSLPKHRSPRLPRPRQPAGHR